MTFSGIVTMDNGTGQADATNVKTIKAHKTI
jgi:hypothetical protein